MRWVSFIQWFSVCWIALTIGAVVASAPLAWRILLEGEAATRGETFVLAWPVIMVVLSVPSGIALLIIRSDMWGDTKMAKWIYGDTATYETVQRRSHRSLLQEAAKAAEVAGIVEPRKATLSLGGLTGVIHSFSRRFGGASGKPEERGSSSPVNPDNPTTERIRSSDGKASP